VPFWKALDDICDAAGLSANPQDENGRLAVYFNDSYNPHVAYSGPFRIVATNLSLSQSVQLGGLQRGRPFGRQPEYLNFNFQVYSEPKVPLVGIGQAVPLKVTDDTGASMVTPAEPGQTVSYYPPQMSYRTFNQSASLNLTRAVRGATEIKSLKARIPLLLLSDTRPDVVIPDPLAAKGKRFSGHDVDVEVANVAEQNGVFTFTLAVTRRDGSEDDYSWMNGLTSRFEMFDAKGKKLPMESVDQNNNGPNACTFTVSFGANRGAVKGLRPAKLVLVEWIHITQNVEFEFKGIPLP
ncbi:MAG: hypothetical protein ACRC7O_19390, partial [Fimbriiglobus sp.]